MTESLMINNKLGIENSQRQSTITSASALVEMLAEIGVDTVFGYPGAAVLSIYNELSLNKSIKHILVRHEQAAVHMAEGYAKASGKVGTVLVTSGPGFTNTITGIANAYADSTPLVILAGDVPLSNTKGKVFQKVDIISMTKTCSKKSYLVTSKDDIKQIIEEAYETANSGDKGPVVIALPRNILEAKYTPKVTKDLYRKKQTPISEYEFERTYKLLQNAEKPLLLLGGGAVNSDIGTLVAKLNIPVVSTLMGIGIYPSSADLYLGMIGMNGSYSANTAIAESDLVIALGVSFSDRSTCRKSDFAKNAKIVSVNTKRASFGFELEISSSAENFVEGFMEYINSKELQNNSAWISQVKYLKGENHKEPLSTECLHSSYVLETIYEFTKDKNPVVVTDVGQHQLLTAQYFNFNEPKKFITSGGLGTMGYGLPAAIGAYIANHRNLVLNITGDGSFQMNLQELATCREHHIPIKIIIMNNNSLGMVRQMQEKIYNNLYQVEMINPDFTKIAEAYDLLAVRVTKSNELIPALEKTIPNNKTAIIDIAIDSEEEI